MFAITNKIIKFNVSESSNLWYNLFIFIPYKTSFQINFKKINTANFYNLFVNISMSTLFFLVGWLFKKL
uniref:Uncharacterized protein n=1 Tax=Oxytricha trifallax TaxID=1172189 RepID=G9HRJ9_9SPIT|nr:hypothetical protein [Oxytricha trifallax]